MERVELADQISSHVQIGVCKKLKNRQQILKWWDFRAPSVYLLQMVSFIAAVMQDNHHLHHTLNKKEFTALQKKNRNDLASKTFGQVWLEKIE